MLERPRHTVWIVALACLFGGLVLLAPPSASASLGPKLATFGEFGSGSGQLELNGGGIAADPASGHLFVSELFNNRVSEFTAWGEFVKAWGWGVADGSSEASQTCNGPCFPGIEGSGVGQLNRPNGIALSPSGNVYVYERNSRRIQVFDQEGEFLRMFGAEVNKTTEADVCTAADVEGGDECGIGVEGTGPSEFSILSALPSELAGTFADYIDIAPDGTVYVGDRDRIQIFEPDGTYVESLILPEPGNPAALDYDDSSGDLYFGYQFSNEPSAAYRLNAETGAVIYELPTIAVEGIATGPDGTVYVTDDPEPVFNFFPEENPRVKEIDTSGDLVDECCVSTSQGGEHIKLPALTTNVVTAAGGVELYVMHDRLAKEVAFVEVRGPAPDKWPPPVVPPTIEAQFATAVGFDSASIGARINPNFWSDTSYHLEYGIAPCSGGGCESTTEVELGAGIVKEGVTIDPIDLEGLEAGTTYHYRFLAESGGGSTIAEPEGTFTTFTGEEAQPPCANDGFRQGAGGFRQGAGARLRDCRAYELVSPVDKLGGDILVQGNINSTPARLNQARPDGNLVTYSAYRSFGDAESAGYTTQYLANRGAGGWSSTGISPVREGPSPTPTSGLDSQYKGFLDDLSSGWFVHDTEPVLAAGAVPGYTDLYRRDGVADAYEAVTTVQPSNKDAANYSVELQGASATGTRTVFRANGKLTANATSATVTQVYEFSKGLLRLVSVRPNGAAANGGATVGSLGAAAGNGREANVQGAVSTDGTRIYWSEGGKLYVRVNGAETIAVSAGSSATFWAGKPDGSEAIYSEAGALELFDLASEESNTLVSEGVLGVMGQSADLSRIYVVSTAPLAGAAEAGKRNLYVYEEGEPLTYVTTLSAEDMEPTLPSPVSVSPRTRLSRVSSDGQTAIFMSRGSLTGASNVDQASGKADAEVFRYEAASQELRCLSCDRNGAAPAGRDLVDNGLPSGYWYASKIPGWEFQMHAGRVLSEDGQRVFFDSLNRLSVADTNGKQDVYQWEAPGTGSCDEGDGDFNPAAGGCVSLISSGADIRDSEFVDASSDGRDVFFLTGQSLVDWDPGQIDLYDARVLGGFPAPPQIPAECEGEACSGSPAPVPAPLPNASQGFFGPGNPKPAKRCKRGFKRSKKSGKCVRKRHKRHAKHDRKAGKRKGKANKRKGGSKRVAGGRGGR